MSAAYVALLEKARELIVREIADLRDTARPIGICAAVWTAHQRLYGDGRFCDADNLTNEISRRLGRCAYLEDWLYRRRCVSRTLHETPFHSWPPEKFRKLQNTRVAWIDALIEEFKDKP